MQPDTLFQQTRVMQLFLDIQSGFLEQNVREYGPLKKTVKNKMFV